MQFKQFILITCTISFLSSCATSTDHFYSNKPAKIETTPTFFNLTDALDFTLSADFKEAKSKGADRWIPAKLIDKDNTAIQGQIKVRGQSRLKDCKYSPLWLRLENKQKKGSWASFRRAKVVITCDDGKDEGGKSYEQRIRREYLLYKLYEELFEVAFLTRPFHASFHQEKQNSRYDLDTFGFFIERPGLLERRLSEWKQYEVDGIDGKELNPFPIGKQLAFSWATGDVDKQIKPSGLGNVKVFKNDNGIVRTVFYDFDRSGFVRDNWHADKHGMYGGCYGKEELRKSLTWVTTNNLLQAVGQIKVSNDLEDDLKTLRTYILKSQSIAVKILNDPKNFNKFNRKSKRRCNK